MSGALHASCVARAGALPGNRQDSPQASPQASLKGSLQGVLLLGPPGSGKSDLALRLIDRGFTLVADDQVLVQMGLAQAPAALAGLLEVRGLGLLRLPYLPAAPLVLAVQLGAHVPRLPDPARLPGLDLPLICVDAQAPSAPLVVAAALDVIAGQRALLAGALA